MSEITPIDHEYNPENVQVLPIPQGLYRWFDAFRERRWPLRKKSLNCLQSWLDGYLAARQEAGIPATQEEQEFAGFDDFVCARYNRYDTAGWCAKINYYNCDDDAEALEKFFKLLDEFRLTKKQA
jgi:hypothetical protein